jgi:hypothetical protein
MAIAVAAMADIGTVDIAVVHLALTAVAMAIAVAVAIAAVATAPKVVAGMVGMPAMKALSLLFSLRVRRQLQLQSL